MAAGYDRSFELCLRRTVGSRAAPCGGNVRVCRHHDRARARLQARLRRHRQGLRGRASRDRARRGRAMSGERRRRRRGPRRGHGPWVCRRPPGRSRSSSRRGALATSGRDRRRWRREGRELHHLIDPATGTSADGDLLRVTVVGNDAIDAEVWAKALFLVGAGGGRSRSGRAAACLASSSPPTVARRRREVCSEGSDLLAPRSREWTDRVRAAHTFGARRSRGEIPAVRPGSQGGVSNGHAPVSLAARPRCDRSARRSRSSSTRRCTSVSQLFSIPGLASYRPIATGLGVFAAELAVAHHHFVSAAKTHRCPRLASAALHDVRGLRGGNGARAGGGNGYASPLGLRALPRCGLRRRGCNGLARLESPNPNERSSTCTGS